LGVHHGALPVYSDYEDNDIGGSLTISGLRSCCLDRPLRWAET